MTEPAVDRPGVLDHWNRFWYRPEAVWTLGLVRIGFGATVFAWTVALGVGLFTWFGPDGVQPRPQRGPYTSGVLHLFDESAPALLASWVVLLAAAVALTVGWHSRIAALLVFLGVHGFERLNPYIFNSGDSLLRLEALFLVLAPCGAALSLDIRRRTGSFLSADERAPWGLRLLQVQLSVIYISTVWEKLRGDTWNEGTAVGYALRISELTNLTFPGWVTGDAVLINAATWGTLAIELGIGLFVWHRRARPWLLAVGVVLHLSILFALAVAFFSFAMFVLYLAFVPPETAERWARAAERRFRAGYDRLRRRRATAEA